MKWPISSLSGVAVIMLYCVFTFSSWALFPTAYSPVTSLAERPGQLNLQPQRRNHLQPRLHLHRNSPLPILHRNVQMVHNRKMEKNSLTSHPSNRLRSSFCLDNDRRLLRRRWVPTQLMVRHLLPTQPNSARPNGSIPVHASPLHQSHRRLRIRCSRDKPNVPLRIQYTSA